MQKKKYKKYLIILLLIICIIAFQKYIAAMHKYNNNMITSYDNFVQYAKENGIKLTQENYKIFIDSKN